MINATKIVKLHNDIRNSSNLALLQKNDDLTKYACERAQHIADTDDFSHDQFQSTFPVLKFVYGGENLARDSSSDETVMGAWMNSTAHKANILDYQYRSIGVCVRRNVSHEYTVVEFGTLENPSAFITSQPPYTRYAQIALAVVGVVVIFTWGVRRYIRNNYTRLKKVNKIK